MGLRGNKSVVGLELDTGMIRAVEMQGKNGTARIVAAGEMPLPEQAVVEGVVQDVEAVSAALQKLWREARFKSRNVVLGVFNQSVLMRLIEFPKVPKERLAQAIRLQAGDYFPIPLSQLEFDFAVVGETNSDGNVMHEVLLVAAKTADLQTSITALINSKLNPQVIDATPLALLRTLPRARQQGATVMVDLAMGISSIILTVDGMPRYARVLPVKLRDYFSELGSQLNVGDSYTGYVAATVERGSENEAYQRWRQAVTEEIRTFIAYYLQQEQLGNIEAVLLSGRGARTTDLADYLQEDLGVTVEVILPTEIVKLAKGKAQVDLNNPEFAVSTGLALRGLEV